MKAKVYYWDYGGLGEKYLDYVVKNAKPISKFVYYYKNNTGLHIVEIGWGLKMFIPTSCTMEEFLEGVKESTKHFGYVERNVLKEIVYSMLKVPELEDYASILIMEGVI